MDADIILPWWLFVLILLLVPSEALAWGIGVHLQTGSWILENLARLPAPVSTTQRCGEPDSSARERSTISAMSAARRGCWTRCRT